MHTKSIFHGDVVYLYYQSKESEVSKTYRKLEFNVENQMIESLTKLSMKRPRQEVTFEENNIHHDNQNINDILSHYHTYTMNIWISVYYP